MHRSQPFIQHQGTVQLTKEWYERKMPSSQYNKFLLELASSERVKGDRTGSFFERSFTWEVLRTRSPRSLYLRDVLDASARKGLMQLAESRLAQSLVGTDAKADTAVRTSTGCFLTSPADAVHPANAALRVAAAALFGVPTSHVEPTQILRYQSGQHYLPHFDAWEATNQTVLHPRDWRGRVATIVVWLNTVERGGNTSFPGAAIGKTPLTLRPVGGDGVLFYSVTEGFQEGTDRVRRRVLKMDEASIHAGEAAEEEKWVAALWCHLNPVS